MGVLDEVVEIPRKTMILFFLVDTSSSMAGDKIASLNEGIRDVIPDLRDISNDNADANIKIAVLDFASGTQWITESPQPLDAFEWQDLQADGVTDLGEAFAELNSKLSKDAFLQDAVGSYAPVIILISDGAPTDNYRKGLDALRSNRWFQVAIRIALAVDGADEEILAKFTGSPETVIQISNKAMMNRMIRFVSVTSSRIGSQLGGVASRQQEVEKAITSEMAELAEMEELDVEKSFDDSW